MAQQQKMVGNYRVIVDYDESPYNPFDDIDLAELRIGSAESNNDEIALFVWKFEHSVFRFSTSETLEHNPFGNGMYARFDSCPYGQIAIKKEEAKKMWAEEWEEKAKEYMNALVDEYEKYINGEVYRVSIFDENDEIVEEYGGFYSEEDAMDCGTENAEAFIVYDNKERNKLLEDKDTSMDALLDEVFGGIEEGWREMVYEALGLADKELVCEWLRKQIAEKMERLGKTENRYGE